MSRPRIHHDETRADDQEERDGYQDSSGSSVEEAAELPGSHVSDLQDELFDLPEKSRAVVGRGIEDSQ